MTSPIDFHDTLQVKPSSLTGILAIDPGLCTVNMETLCSRFYAVISGTSVDINMGFSGECLESNRDSIRTRTRLGRDLTPIRVTRDLSVTLSQLS